MNIIWVRLVTGEDLVADGYEEEGLVVLNKPVRIVMTHDGIAMVPAPPFCKSKELKIKSEHVVFIAEPEDEVRNGYNEKFGSGIVTASHLSILT